MKVVCCIILMTIGATLAAAAQIPASELPGRERVRFIERPGENLLLRRAPATRLPWEATAPSGGKCRVHIAHSSRMKTVRRGAC